MVRLKIIGHEIAFESYRWCVAAQKWPVWALYGLRWIKTTDL